MLADNEPGQDTYRRLLRPAHFLGPSPETPCLGCDQLPALRPDHKALVGATIKK